MFNLYEYKLSLEETILVSFLDQNNCNELDQMEYIDFKLPYELFTATKTTKLVSKAIYNLQIENRAVSELNVFYYIKKFVDLDNDYIRLIAKTGLTFETMKKYLQQLKEVNEEIKTNERLKEI